MNFTRVDILKMRNELKLNNQFQCDNCGGVFNMEWSDEDAVKEAKVNCPDLKAEDRIVVCHDCMTALRNWKRKLD